MLNFFKKNKEEKNTGTMPWNTQAKQALEQSVAQAPVPQILKGKVKKELAKAAEKAAQAAGHTEVTAEDLMAGLMEKLPAKMKKQVEQAARQGPQGLKNLQQQLSKKNKKK